MPDDWTPDKPLPDAEDEKEAVERAQRAARVDYLKGQNLAKVKPAKPAKNPKAWD